MSIKKSEDFDPISNCNSGLNTDVIALCCKSQAGSRIDMRAWQKKFRFPGTSNHETSFATISEKKYFTRRSITPLVYSFQSQFLDR